MDAGHILEDHALIYRNGIIEDIVRNSDVAADMEGIDARDAIVCPGLINTHMHMYGVITHGKQIASMGNSLKPFLENYWWPFVEDRMNHHRIAATTKYSCMDMLKSGVTCFDDILEAPNALPDCLSLESEIVEKIGMRAVLSFEASERVSTQNGDMGLRENAEFIRAQRMKKNALTRGMMCFHTTFSCSREFIRKAHRMAEEIDSSIQLHLSEGSDESRWCYQHYGKLPVELYEEIGVLDERMLASQCVIMDPVEVSLMAKRGVRVSHQPISNCGIGAGVSPAVDMLSQGMLLGLGTDGDNNDMFETMRAACLIHKAKRMDLNVMPCSQVFQMATEMGAKAIGYEKIGALRKGYYADFLVINADTPTRITCENAVEQLVMHRKASDIRHIAVNGRLLMENGRLTSLNETDVRQEMRACADDYWKELE